MSTPLLRRALRCFLSPLRLRCPLSPACPERSRRVTCTLLLLFCALSPITCPLSFAQMETATLSGVVNDPKGAVVPDVDVTATRIETGTVLTTKTNGAGIYFFTSLMPGHYHLTVRKPGFKEIAIRQIELHVQDKLERNFSLEIGSVSESVTVTGEIPLLNTQDAAVSTVVDRQFAENLPMNGRSFQTLIQLTPGVVLTVSSVFDSGQFSINGQRANANYWTVDGAGANIGIGAVFVPRNGSGGALPSFSAQGGTNGLVSTDAMQEFRILTSTYAPEFGRTPGGQISIVTRSGANQFHGTLFDFLRNDVLDANDWFANRAKLPKPKERQNDFGGTFSGPILRDRTFFFFSYEGLRLRLPQVAETTVPSISARQSAAPALQPFLNAYPLPNPNAPDTGPNPAPFSASFSNNSTLDAYSLRVDHRLNNKLSVFGRYNYSRSEIIQRGLGGATYSLSTVFPARITTQTATVGATWFISPITTNDLRFNYSRTESFSRAFLDNFGGAVPLTSLPLPSPFTSQNANFQLFVFSLANGAIQQGRNVRNLQRQVNIVDSLSMQKGSHSLKSGVDFRRLSPVFDPSAYNQFVFFSDVQSFETGNLSFSFLTANRSARLLFYNLGAFAQDTWRISHRLTLTYGLRWDVDFAPNSDNGINILAVINFDDLSKLALAPAGAPPFNTPYGNVAPRLGVAYQISQNPDWGTVVRGGLGVFFDLATQEAGAALFGNYPFGASKFNPGGTFPLSPAAGVPPPFSAASLSSQTLYAFDPDLQLPYTLGWNVAIAQPLGKQQALSVSYIGSVGRRLIQTAFIFSPNPTFGSANLVSNTATSDYDALQLQYQRRLSHGLQALASYTWSHSIDTASAGSFGNAANTLVPTLNPNANRGASDFDIRHTFSAGVTYDIPAPKKNLLANAILRGWSLQNVIQARSAPPVNVFDSRFFQLANANTLIRPDVISGQSLYLFSSVYPGGRALNPAAFTDPPTDASGNPLRQGTLGRNALRGFGATQWDFAVHRTFPIHESITLQFRAELFNVLNHSNFAPPVADLNNRTQFGQSTQMLGRYLASFNQAGGSFSPLYQMGGPRSVQFALKLHF